LIRSQAGISRAGFRGYSLGQPEVEMQPWANDDIGPDICLEWL